jgi:hypothetical protein
MRNVAFTYDNAVALLAFLASGERGRAGLLADALLYALQRDRCYQDGRLRNAYQGGDLVVPNGWVANGKKATVRMPGWYDTQEGWLEDEFNVSTHTGNVAWAMLSLLAYYSVAGGEKYLEAAGTMGEWVQRECRNDEGPGGYAAGFQGREPNPRRLTYKATEHNIDLYAAFRLLHLLTREDKWMDRAEHAKRFVLAMWDPAAGKLWTGTKDDGKTINRDAVPLDIQPWSALAFGKEGSPYWGALSYAEARHKVGQGYDFDEDRDGIWYEGTAHMALAYRLCGQPGRATSILSFLRSAQYPSGGLPAASRDRLTTGFDWLYFHRAHVGATAWFVLAENGSNPFGTSTTRLYFPQFASGTQGGASVFSQITLINMNSSACANVLVEIDDDTGEPLAVHLNGEEVPGRLEVAIPASGSIALDTGGIGQLSTGSVLVTSGEPISGFVLYGGTLGLAGVTAGQPLRKFVGPVRTNSGTSVGVAMMGLGEAQTIHLELRDEGGNLVATAGVGLGARSHVARLVSEFGWDSPPNFTNFRGTLCAVGDADFAATLVLASGGDVATLPVAEGQ